MRTMPATRTYVGERDKRGMCHVWVIGEDGDAFGLPLRLDLRNHSPTGFEWSYLGSGPAQLALALLADATGNDVVATKSYQHFKRAVISVLPRNKTWRLTQDDIVQMLKEIGSKQS